MHQSSLSSKRIKLPYNTNEKSEGEKKNFLFNKLSLNLNKVKADNRLELRSNSCEKL